MSSLASVQFDVFLQVSDVEILSFLFRTNTNLISLFLSISYFCWAFSIDNVRYDCSFEHDMCGWQNTSDDQRDWQRIQGSTPTPDTGPATDHTGNNGIGKNFKGCCSVPWWDVIVGTRHFFFICDRS